MNEIAENLTPDQYENFRYIAKDVLGHKNCVYGCNSYHRLREFIKFETRHKLVLIESFQPFNKSNPHAGALRWFEQTYYRPNRRKG